MKRLAAIESIFIAPEAGERMQSVAHVRAVPGRGLEGDRYYAGTGSFSRWPGPHRDLTLIAAEDLEAMNADAGIRLAAADSRRNVLVQGLDLRALIGRRIRLGNVEVEIKRKCAPCKYLGRKTGIDDIVPIMSGRGGVRAHILREGVLSVGDPIFVASDNSHAD